MDKVQWFLFSELKILLFLPRRVQLNFFLPLKADGFDLMSQKRGTVFNTSIIDSRRRKKSSPLFVALVRNKILGATFKDKRAARRSRKIFPSDVSLISDRSLNYSTAPLCACYIACNGFTLSLLIGQSIS